MTSQVNVLFTSVGRRVELVRAFRRAYEGLALDGRIVATDIDPLAPALRLADRTYFVPRVSDPAYAGTLIDICRQERISMVFPLIDPDIPVLAAHRDEIGATGAVPMVVDAEAAAVVSDKWETFQWFRAHALPTPDTWLPTEREPGELPYPVFIKPRRGSASAKCFKVRNATELRFFSEYIDEPIVQECLEGPEVTSDVVCDASGVVLGVVSRQRIESRWGEVAKGFTVFDECITASCRRVATALPAIGPITVQGMWNRGRFLFTEINARFGGGAPLGIAAGADSPRWLLARAAGLCIEMPPLGHYVRDLMLTRFDESYFLTRSADGTLAHYPL